MPEVPCKNKMCGAFVKSECRYPNWKLCPFMRENGPSGIGNLDLLKGDAKNA